MLNTILNVFFGNIRTLVAAGTANAIKTGIADGVALATESLTLEYGGPSEADDIDLEPLRLEDLVIE